MRFALCCLDQSMQYSSPNPVNIPSLFQPISRLTAVTALVRAQPARPRRILGSLPGVLAVGLFTTLTACAPPTTSSATTQTPMPSTLANTPALTPTSTYLRSWPTPPQCSTTAPALDSQICTVSLPKGVSGSTVYASANSSLLFRAGWGDPTKQSCDQFSANAGITITVDGKVVSATILPCQLVALTGNCTNQWVYDARFVSDPLKPGTHNAVATFTFNGPVSGADGCSGPESTTPAGTVQTYQKTVIVT